MDGIITRISEAIAFKSLKLLQITRHLLQGRLMPQQSQPLGQPLPPRRLPASTLAVASAALTIGLFALPPLFAQTFVQPADPEAKTIQQKLLRATPVPLNKVRLTGGPLLKAQELTKQYLLTLEPDRMLA